MSVLSRFLEHIKLDFAFVAVCGIGWLRQTASETFFNISYFFAFAG